MKVWKNLKDIFIFQAVIEDWSFIGRHINRGENDRYVIILTRDDWEFRTNGSNLYGSLNIDGQRLNRWKQ